MKLLTIALLSLPAAALAADAPKGELPQKNDVLESVVAASPLREATPDATFGGRAPQIGWVKKGEPVRVLETRQYLTIFGLEIWLQVQKVDEPGVSGWVLDGMSQDILKGKASLAIRSRATASEEAKPDPRAAAASDAARKADALVEDIE